MLNWPFPLEQELERPSFSGGFYSCLSEKVAVGMQRSRLQKPWGMPVIRAVLSLPRLDHRMDFVVS